MLNENLIENLINEDFEKAFLGACLMDSQCFTETELSADDFGFVAHQRIFPAIAAVHEAQNTTDLLIVADFLKKNGDLNRVGTDTVFELYKVCVDTDMVNIAFYAAEIRRLSRKRKHVAELQKAKVEMMAVDTDPEAVMSKLFAVTEKYQQGSDNSGLSYITAAELETIDIPEVKWFIPDFLPSGLTVLAGPAKIGKSYFCWNIAIAVSTGGIAFSNKERLRISEQRNVTYLALEDRIPLLKDRLRRLSEDSLPTRLFIIDDLKGVKFDAVGLKKIEKHIRETHTELLIVDTWKHVAPSIDQKGTSYDMDYELLIPVQRFAHDMNIAIVLVTHTRKAADLENPFNRIQGSSGIQAGCDTMMMLSHDSGSKTLHLVGRRIPANQYAFTIDETGLWTLQGEAQEFHTSELQTSILKFLRDAGDGGLSARDLIELTGADQSTVYVTLRRMVKKGNILQPKKRGRYFISDDHLPELSL